MILDSQGQRERQRLLAVWPLGMGGTPNAFTASSFQGTQFEEDSSGTFLKMADGYGSFNYVFGTSNGVFVVDTPNGAILAFKKAATKNFDPTFAGTYKSVYYQKVGVSTNQNNQETGTASLGHATVTIDPSGAVTVTDAESNVLLSATVTAGDGCFVSLRVGWRVDRPRLRPVYVPPVSRITTTGCLRHFCR